MCFKENITPNLRCGQKTWMCFKENITPNLRCGQKTWEEVDYQLVVVPSINQYVLFFLIKSVTWKFLTYISTRRISKYFNSKAWYVDLKSNYVYFSSKFEF